MRVCDNSNTDEGKEPSSSSSQKEENNTDNSQNDDQKEDDNQEEDDSQDKEPTPEYVTVTFDTKGGSTIDSVQVEVGKKVAKPLDPQRQGYTFDGWYLGDEKWSFVGYTVTENITLTAKWVPITYTITYVGDATHSNKEAYTIEDEFELLSGKVETYYEFFGWYEDEKFTKQVTKIEKGTVGNKTLYAKIEYVPLRFELDGDSYKVVGYDKKTASVVIPSTYNGKAVTSIGDGAFRDCTRLASVTIPNSVTSIGKYAFECCTSLTSIEIPNSVTSIGDFVFSSCTSLTSIVIPNGVTSIGTYAFDDCDSLTSIEIPNSVTSIGDYAFRNCTSLKIYCEAKSKPSGWDSDWNSSYRPVVWGYKQGN